MPYKKGRPLIDCSIFFRIASFLTFYLVLLIGYAFCIVFYSPRITGRAKLQKIKKAVLVSNHTTFLDPVLMCAITFPYRTYQTLLEETILIPFLGTYCRLLGGVPIPLGIRAMHRLPEECQKGFEVYRYMHFYPEGECYLYNQDVFPFLPGAFFVAAKFDVPIVPIATVFKSRRGGKKPRAHLYVLDPINPSDFNCKNETTGEVSLKAVRRFAEHVRTVIQSEIDCRSGTRQFYKGALPRVVGANKQSQIKV